PGNLWHVRARIGASDRLNLRTGDSSCRTQALSLSLNGKTRCTSQSLEHHLENRCGVLPRDGRNLLTCLPFLVRGHLRVVCPRNAHSGPLLLLASQSLACLSLCLSHGSLNGRGKRSGPA